MTLWTDLPPAVRNSGHLDALQGPLSGLTATSQPDVTEDGVIYGVKQLAIDGVTMMGMTVDPSTGQVRAAGAGGGGSTPIEFSSPTNTQVIARLGIAKTPANGAWFLDLQVPGIRIKVPQLRGAKLDPQGQLRFDPANPDVKFLLPGLVIRISQPAGGSIGCRLKSATHSGAAQEDIYSMIAMQPAHALIGPGDTVGFAFRSAVLDLSGVAGPASPPPSARVQPDAWQGLFLPEVRLFVAPDGLEGIAVSAGVKDLWIGIGEHAGLTGKFSAEVVNRGGAPVVTARFITPDGRHVPAAAGANPDIPDGSLLLVDAQGGLAPHSTVITVDGAPRPPGDRVRVSYPASGTQRFSVRVTDAGGNAQAPVVYDAQKPATAPGVPALPGREPTIEQRTPERGRIVIESATATDVTLRLDPEAPATWTLPGGGTRTGSRVTVPLAAGATADVRAVMTTPPATPVDLRCYFVLNHPQPSEMTDAWKRNERNTSAQPEPAKVSFRQLASDRRAEIGNRTLTVAGYASYERDENAASDLALSENRRQVLMELLTGLGYTVVPGEALGHARAKSAPAGGPRPGAAEWRVARAFDASPAATADPVLATITRPPAVTLPEPDPAPPAPTTGRPDCFRKLGVEVELIRDTFVRCEIWGEFDMQTALESSLDEGGQPPIGTPIPNPGDGLCAFRVRLRLATDRAAWEVFGEFRALENDLDGLIQRRADQAGVDADVLNTLGSLAVMGPLAATVANLSPAAGTLVQLGSLALGASGVIETRVLTLRGADLTVSNGIIAPDGSTTTDTGTQVSVMFDVEVEFTFDISIIRTAPGRTLNVRYQSVGVRSEWDTGAEVAYVPIPVFDPARGYEFEIEPGALVAQSPLDEILRIMGVRVSRDNPVFLEIEAGLGVDLGPVSVDTVRVRIDLSGANPPQLTKLGAGIDIPGTVRGSGSIALEGDGFEAAFDLTLVPLDVRAAATLAIATRDGVTGVLIGVEVEFPIPLVLGSSGLGIYGLMGGVGINYARTEVAGPVPALAWLKKQYEGAGVMDPDGWEHRPESYAVAAGLLVGTLEGGYVLHLKGVVLFELPGPRLLLTTKADVLQPPKGMTEEATFLAVLDIDFGRGTITIGVVADYKIEKILTIHVPVTAYFETDDPTQWLVHLGSYDDPVSVKVLDVFDATGYLMIHGDGSSINVPELPAISGGLAIATGFDLQAILMGSRSAGLYLEVAVGFDAILGFDPFYLYGKAYLRGELRLWVVSVGVDATLEIIVGKRIVNGVAVEQQPYVHGRVCGSVDFFFFEASACLELTLGSKPDKQPVPRDLIAGVSLVGRSAALVEGTGTDVTDGASLGEAVESGAAGTEPVVPIDAIPAIRFLDPPIAAGLTFAGSAVLGTTGAGGAGAWRRIGDRWWAYQVTQVTLTALDAAAPIGAGPQPANWWAPSKPGATGEGPALALLCWQVTPFSRTITYGEALKDQVEHRWGTVCTPAAPAQRQLWTFITEKLGPSATGWSLPAIAWPDPPGTLRSNTAVRRLRVTEPWRCGDPRIDLLQGTAAAEVIGDLVAVPEGSQETDLIHLVAVHHQAMASQGAIPNEPTNRSREGIDPRLATEVLLGGGSLGDLAALIEDQAADPDLWPGLNAEARILRSPSLTSPEPAPRGTDADREATERAWSEAGHRPEELADAVALSPGEEIAALRALLLVPFQERTLVASMRDKDGNELDRVVIDSSYSVSSARPLPGQWVDPAGPFRDPVLRVIALAERLAPGRRKSGLFLLDLEDLPHEATTVVIGWDRYLSEDELAESGATDPFLVLAADGLTLAEIRRHDFDTTTVTHDKDALEQALTQDPTNHALLAPGGRYQVSVDWRAVAQEGQDKPTSDPVFDPAAPVTTQSFTFRTAPRAEAPTDLTPWLLDTSPGMGDSGVFCKEPLRVALAHENVTRLFDAYGRRLEVKVLSASGKHPRPPGGGDPGQSLVIPLAGVADFVVRRPQGLVLSPWDEVLGELVTDKPCVDVSNVVRTIEEWLLAYDLEPLTDYLLDIYSVSKTDANDRKRVHRANFSTGRFTDLGQFGTWIRQASTEHRLVRDRAPLDLLAGQVTGAQWDAAVQSAGLPVPEVPGAPRVEVWWIQPPNAPAEPYAVVVESSEQLFRDRVQPTVAFAPANGTDPSRKWWVAKMRSWLKVGASTAPPGPWPVAALSGDPVVAPGATRAMFKLPSGSRGHELRLDLITAADELANLAEERSLAVQVVLDQAPWEVED